jgi:hypothetical protein
VPAADTYGKGIYPGLLMGIEVHFYNLLEEPEICSVEPEVLGCVHKLQETWDGKCELVVESHLEVPKARSTDPTNKCFQVSADTLEPQTVKARKFDGCHNWNMRVMPL